LSILLAPIFIILSASAEAERDRPRERITGVKCKSISARWRGRFLRASVPFGWRQEGGDLVPVPEQQVAITGMRRLQAKGFSLRAIRDRMAAEGEKLSHVTVDDALTAALVDAA